MHTPGDSIPFALPELDQRLYEPREVPLGKLCGCICPGCRQPVYAKHCMSGKRAPHFAHAPGSDCASGFETAVHLAAKQLIEARGLLAFPALIASIEVTNANGVTHGPSAELVAAGQRALSDVVLEESLGQIRPDVRVEAEGVGTVLVEVAVTHFVDDYKLDLIEQRGVAAIEIDVSLFRDATFAALETALFEDPTRTRWLYHPQVTSAEADLLSSIKDKLDAAEMSAAYRSYSRAQMEEVERAYRLAEREREADQERIRAEKRRAEAEQEASRQMVAEEARRKQRHETLKKASAFKARPEDHKRLILLRRLGLPNLPAILGANVHGAASFGVANPLVWQTTLFGGANPQTGGGRPWMDRHQLCAGVDALSLLDTPALAQSANNAIDESLMNLSAVGALIPCRNAFFAIAIADLAAIETLDAVRKDRSFDPARFQWVPRDKWLSRHKFARHSQVSQNTVFSKSTGDSFSFKSFGSACSVLAGVKLMIRKGQFAIDGATSCVCRPVLCVSRASPFSVIRGHAQNG
jgi:hypothetical protein